MTWWPDLAWPRIENFTKVAKKMGDKVGENLAALRAAVFLLSAKNRRGVFKHTPPPSRAKVNVNRFLPKKKWHRGFLITGYRDTDTLGPTDHDILRPASRYTLKKQFENVLEMVSLSTQIVSQIWTYLIQVSKSKSFYARMSLFKKWGDHIRLCIGFIMIALIWSSIENMYLEKEFH